MDNIDAFTQTTWSLETALVWIMWRDADKVREFASVDRERFIEGNISLELDPKAVQPYLRFDQAFNELQNEGAYRGLRGTAIGVQLPLCFSIPAAVWPAVLPNVNEDLASLYTQEIEIAEGRRFARPAKPAFTEVQFPRSEIVKRWAQLAPGKAGLSQLPEKNGISFERVVDCLARNGKELPDYRFNRTPLGKRACALLVEMLVNGECEAKANVGLNYAAVSNEVWRAIAANVEGYTLKVRIDSGESRGFFPGPGSFISRPHDHDLIRIMIYFKSSGLQRPQFDKSEKARRGRPVSRDWSPYDDFVRQELREHGDPRRKECLKYASLREFSRVVQNLIADAEGFEPDLDGVYSHVARIVRDTFRKRSQ